MSESEAPFTSLGKHLRYVREQSRQSLQEVSGAVEIDETHLERIEAGVERPAEDILLLLISHFGVKDREAVQLWESAEYDSDMPDEIKGQELVQGGKPAVMLLAMDMRAIYSDGLDVDVNPAGVTVSFTQTQSKSDPTPVARVGMSLEQAATVAEALQRAILQAHHSRQTKQLPPAAE